MHNNYELYQYLIKNLYFRSYTYTLIYSSTYEYKRANKININ